MLSACLASPETRPARAADPIVETRTVREKVCPDEVAAPLPPRIATPAGAAIAASEEVLRWIGQRFAREEVLEKRLADARAGCGA
ncbi:MAG: hypothetical protein CVT77_06490 [Alphaproteobacteria bacterium HGW-Alphaproteobacteria-16]|nr:MAG: hypothetical protein CVT77_06490 [Alphaproteobacteria bacterium HGW-Alphaproteobacteria-16]